MLKNYVFLIFVIFKKINLVRLCSSIVDYFESFNKCIEDFFDVGLVREAEAHSISLWKHSLYFGLSFRFNLFFFNF